MFDFGGNFCSGTKFCQFYVETISDRTHTKGKVLKSANDFKHFLTVFEFGLEMGLGEGGGHGWIGGRRRGRSVFRLNFYYSKLRLLW